MYEKKKEENNEENKKIPVNENSKPIKKYNTRSERKAALIFKLYSLIQGNN